MPKSPTFGVCHVSVAPVRATASDTSETVTQLLFGDYVRIIETGKPWIKIIVERDGYDGWMDIKQLAIISKDEFERDANTDHTLVHNRLLMLHGPHGEQMIVISSALPNYEDHRCSFGDMEFEIHDILHHQRHSMAETAEIYLNSPYLWGGKSFLGLDCSGFVQNVARLHGYNIPRDTSKQIAAGAEVPFEERKKGDIAFFVNDKGKIHHVGILMTTGTTIHASGFVRKDSFDEKGIFREDVGEHTHKLHSIRHLG